MEAPKEVVHLAITPSKGTRDLPPQDCYLWLCPYI